MKKNILSIITVLVIAFITLTGYKKGAAKHGHNCTGAETGLGNMAGCKGSGCHSGNATTNIAVSIELDSAGIATNRYVPGMNYTVKITGVNNGNTTLPNYGFQLGCIVDTVAQTTPINAGAWITTSLPPTTRYAAAMAGSFVMNLVEQSATTTATTGSGTNGSTYSKTFNWKAPTAGTGYISFWGVVNAVNGNSGSDNNDLWNTTHLNISERICNNPSSSSINQSVCGSYSFFGATLTNSGVYNYVMANYLNCDSTITLNLTILPSSSTTMSQTVCKGDSFNFYGTYLKSSGTFTHHFTNYLGCDSLITLHYTVNPVNKSVTVNGTTLTSASNSTYQWLDCNNANAAIVGATNQSFTPVVSGNYAVALTNNVCMDTSLCYSVVVTGISSINQNTLLNLSPNPANHSTVISLQSAVNAATIKLINLTGQTVFEKQNQSGNQFTLELSQQPQGIYFIEVKENEKVWRGKVVKE